MALIIHDKLRELLEELDSSIATALLYYNENSPVNYLGISMDNPLYISYLDDRRTIECQKKKRVKQIDELEIGDKVTLTKKSLAGSGIHGNSVFKIINETSPSFLVERLNKPTRTFWITNNDIKRIKTKTPDYWNPKLRYHASCVKVAKKILGTQFEEYQYNNFCSEYVAFHPSSDVLSRYELKFVSKEDIRKYYHVDNYYREASSLGGSCMRHKKCQKYLDIYVDNPDKIQLFVALRNDMVVARCLIWEDIYFDRIYSIDDSITHAVKTHLTALGLHDIYSHWRSHFISLDNTEYDYYPYMDTFKYLTYRGLSTDEEDDAKILNSQDGGYEDPSYATCDCCECSLSQDEARYSEYSGGTYCVDCSAWSEYMGDVIPQNSAVWSECMDSYILDENSYRTYNNDYVHEDEAIELTNGDYAYKDDDNIIEIDNDWYLKDDKNIVEINGIYHLIDDDNIVCYEDTYYLVDDCKWSNYHDCYIPKELVKYYNNDYFLIEEVKNQLELELT